MKRYNEIVENAVKDNFEKHLEIYLDMYRQQRKIRFWALSLRVLFLSLIPLLIGGSIYGYYLLPGLVDKVIGSRVEIVDRLPTAILYAESGDFEKAAILLDYMWKDVIEDEKIKNDEFKELYLKNYLWVISSVDIKKGRFDEAMSKRWAKLKSSKSFEKLKSDARDDVIDSNVLISEMKFNFNKNDVMTYLSEMKDMVDRAKISGDKFVEADLSYQYSILSLIFENNKDAVCYLLKAHYLNPSEYHLDDWSKYKNSYFNSPSYKIYEYFAREYGFSNLRQQHEELVKKTARELDSNGVSNCMVSYNGTDYSAYKYIVPTYK
ncbi:hypothetical protein [Aeromonas dhakensis]|uniref:hypothetical protein n=1 Tax=Aeromonas dhakensis TaxID=196024 RepID=UPI00301CD4F5